MLAERIMTHPVFITPTVFHDIVSWIQWVQGYFRIADTLPRDILNIQTLAFVVQGTISSDNCDKTLDGHNNISNVTLFERREDINSPSDTRHCKQLAVEVLSKREWEILEISYGNNKSPWFPLNACNNDFNGPY